MSDETLEARVREALKPLIDELSFYAVMAGEADATGHPHVYDEAVTKGGDVADRMAAAVARALAAQRAKFNEVLRSMEMEALDLLEERLIENAALAALGREP